MVLFCNSFGSRFERPRALQLLIKMMIADVGGACPFISELPVYTEKHGSERVHQKRCCERA